jgi:hypothetical protein
MNWIVISPIRIIPKRFQGAGMIHLAGIRKSRITIVMIDNNNYAWG